jgi:hypothetical protein
LCLSTASYRILLAGSICLALAKVLTSERDQEKIVSDSLRKDLAHRQEVIRHKDEEISLRPSQLTL